MEDTTTTTSTPVTTTETTTAAPATTETSQPTTTSQRPTDVKSLAQFMADHAPAAAATTDPAAQPEAATTVPAADVDPNGAPHPTEKKGPIPFEVHDKALQNARTKSAAEVREQFAPIERAMQSWQPIAQRMTTDPAGFVRDFIAEVAANNPAVAAQMRSEAGRMLAGGRSAAVDAEPQPDVQIVDATGHVTGTTYSAKRLAERDAWNERRLLAKVGEQIAPFQADRQQRIDHERTTALQADVNAKADETMAELRDILDGDESLFADVSALMTANPSWSAHKATLEVRKTKIVPTLAGKAQARAVESFQKKAAGNTANGTGTTAAPARLKNAKDIARFLSERAG